MNSVPPLTKKRKTSVNLNIEDVTYNHPTESTDSECRSHDDSHLNVQSKELPSLSAPSSSKSNIFMEDCQLQSSAKSIQITNRKGEPATLDNWTETSDDIDPR